MFNCVVRGCKSSANGNPGLHFFMLPRDSFVKREWLDILSLKSRQVTENTRVCELHFKEKDFQTSGTGKKSLKSHSVPVLKIGKGSVRDSDDENEEFMQCDSDSDPEIVEVKKISKQMSENIKQERISPPPSAKKEPEEKPMEQETGRRPSRRAAQLAVQKIHNTVKSLALPSDTVMTENEVSNTPKTTWPRTPRAPRSTVQTYKGARRGRKPRNNTPVMILPSPVTVTKVPKLSEQRVWHSVRAPASDLDLQMECHEELLSVSQAEALMKAQTEYNNVMKTLRALKANNARIILETNERPENPSTPTPQNQTSMLISSPGVLKSQKNPAGSIMVKQANLFQTSSSGVTVVPVHLVTVHQSSNSPQNQANLGNTRG